MGKTQKKNNNLEEIIKFAQMLSAKQQEEALKQIRKIFLISNAERLDKSGKPSYLTEEEIIAECRAVRRERSERYAKN